MLLEEAEPTHAECNRTMESARKPADNPSVKVSGTEFERSVIDPFVQKIIAGTCGIMYIPLIGKFTHYPIPDLRLPEGSGKNFLDIGCSWGRWCISAARAGYHPVGIDPSLEAVQAARRVAKHLNVSASYLVADARYLPFTHNCFDIAFSYSVLQHFDKLDVKIALEEVARVLAPSGISLIQMPNLFGLVNIVFQIMGRNRDPELFDVRYWKPSDLKETFTRIIGPTDLSVDGYLSLNSQKSDIGLLPLRYKPVVALSEHLRRMSKRVPWLINFADSLYLCSTPRITEK